MKKIFVSILLFTAINSFAQDSSNLKVSAVIQARDLETIAEIVWVRSDFEEMMDNLKPKFRVGNPPSGNTNVTVDTVQLWLWAEINFMLRSDPSSKNVHNRVNAVLMALNIPWLTNRLNNHEAIFDSRASSSQTAGRKKLRKS